jgi:two-component system, NarL family, nitrate/nitrite response regulator NarL
MNSEQSVAGETTIRVLVADNSRIYTRLLSDELKRDPLLLVTPFESESSNLVTEATSHNIDVLVISSNVDEQPARGFEVVRQLRAANPQVRSVLLADSSKDEAVLQAFRAGAKGVFGRNDPMELLSRCVRCVYQGQIWASSRHLRIAMDALANSPAVRAVNANGMSLLSERELQVVGCLAEGLTNREIAKRLELSQHTIKNYFFRIFDKLGVSSRVELLFMSLSQAAAAQPSERRTSVAAQNSDEVSHYESDVLRKSAEAGMPAAQLALAQLCLARRSDPQDVVDAYMWYLIATESATQARGFITRMLSVEQIEEAKRRASIWLAKRKHKPPSSANSGPSNQSFPDQATYAGAGD